MPARYRRSQQLPPPDDGWARVSSGIRWFFLLACLGLLIWDITLHYHGWRFAFGTWPVPAGTPWTYQLWSGFVPALTVLSLLSGVIALLRHVNCHVAGCLRVGRFPVAGGQFKVCRVHHPDHVVATSGLTQHRISELHLSHLARMYRRDGQQPR